MANEASEEQTVLPASIVDEAGENVDELLLEEPLPIGTDTQSDEPTSITAVSSDTDASNFEESVLDVPTEQSELLISDAASTTDEDGVELVLDEEITVDISDLSSSSSPSSVGSSTDSETNVINEVTETLDVTNDSTTGSTGIESEVTQENDTVVQTEDYINNETIQAGVTDLMDTVVSDVVTLTRQMVTEENYYQFSKQSCVSVGDGTFHCTTDGRATTSASTDIYAERDEGGDMEIYLRTGNGDVKQLSKNDYDDTSPDLDMASGRVVWQRLIDGRYQIISYDLKRGEEQQLTYSRTNSMEPKAAKEGIVWQAWDGNDWEIIFFDGKFTDQITDNEIQDVTPVIEDGYVLWSVLGGETAEARVYSIESGETMTITGHEGGAVANPRFVLVYDTKFDNGDIVTQGFDPVTGLATPIAAKPVDLPFSIPEPDPVGEIIALINNKSTQKDKDVVTIPVTDGGNDLNLANTTAISEDTLNLNNQTDIGGNSIPTIMVTEPSLELSEYDLVITSEASSTNSVLNDAFYETVATTTASAQP